VASRPEETGHVELRPHAATSPEEMRRVGSRAEASGRRVASRPEAKGRRAASRAQASGRRVASRPEAKGRHAASRAEETGHAARCRPWRSRCPRPVGCNGRCHLSVRSSWRRKQPPPARQAGAWPSDRAAGGATETHRRQPASSPARCAATAAKSCLGADSSTRLRTWSGRHECEVRPARGALGQMRCSVGAL